jgi:ribosomal protein S12 methylthiotransferase accessory factor
MGITRIADITGLDFIGIPVCVCVRPNSKSLSVSQGKGLKLMHSKVSAAMESIESYHAENIIHEIITGSYHELNKKEAAINPVTLNLFDRSLYHDKLPIKWICGYDIIQKKQVLVPYDLVHCSFLVKSVKRPTCFVMSSNGLASGNSFWEATSHGICEVIERDASTLVEWRKRSDPRIIEQLLIDTDTVDSPQCRELLDKLEEAGISVYIWNETSETGIPAFGCAINERKSFGFPTPTGACFHGFGCHLSKEIAMVRSITEAVQSRLTYITGSRDDTFRRDYLDACSESEQKAVSTYFSGLQPTIDFTRLPSIETESMEDDVALQLSLLKRHGFNNVIVVDLTKPDIEIPVVRVIIPGMGVMIDNRLCLRYHSGRNRKTESI